MPMILRHVALAAAVCWAAGSAHAQPADEHWYRCNTHTHTSEFEGSDANGSLEAASRWYKAHGYQCLVITDHEHLTDVARANAMFGKDGNFLLLQGQEITQIIADPTHPDGARHAHVNGIGTTRVILPMGHPERFPTGLTLGETFRRNIAEIRAAGGLPQVNHPNLHWSVRPSDLDGIAGPFLLEIWNSFPSSNNLGDPGGEAQSLSPEGLWDKLLSSGRKVWGVASDDTHDYINFDDREAPTPGKGWVVVRAPMLTQAAIQKALAEGQFYASTGIRLDAYEADADGISMAIAPLNNWNTTRPLLTRYMTRFIGKDGRILAEVTGRNPSYSFRGDEEYVRASIIDSDGRRAWTQPVFVVQPSPH